MKNKLREVVMRVPNYLLHLRYESFNSYGAVSEQLDGKGVLVDYENRKIIYLTYRKGLLIDKN